MLSASFRLNSKSYGGRDYIDALAAPCPNLLPGICNCSVTWAGEREWMESQSLKNTTKHVWCFYGWALFLICHLLVLKLGMGGYNRAWGSFPVMKLLLFFSFRSWALCTAGNMKLLMVSNRTGTKEDLIYLEDIPQDRGSELLMNQLHVQLQETTTQSGFSKSPRIILALTAGAHNMSQEPSFFCSAIFHVSSFLKEALPNNCKAAFSASPVTWPDLSHQPHL